MVRLEYFCEHAQGFSSLTQLTSFQSQYKAFVSEYLEDNIPLKIECIEVLSMYYT